MLPFFFKCCFQFVKGQQLPTCWIYSSFPPPTEYFRPLSAEKYLQGVGNRHQYSRYRRHFLQRKFSGAFVNILTSICSFFIVFQRTFCLKPPLFMPLLYTVCSPYGIIVSVRQTPVQFCHIHTSRRTTKNVFISFFSSLSWTKEVGISSMGAVEGSGLGPVPASANCAS